MRPGTWSPTCPAPAGPREEDSPWPAASLAEVTRIYGIRHWIEQSCKQVKDELGWADFQVRSDIAISFCWDAWFAENPAQRDDAAPRPGPGCGEGAPKRRPAVLAAGTARDARLAFPLDRAAALVAGVVHSAPAPQLQALMNSVATGFRKPSHKTGRQAVREPAHRDLSTLRSRLTSIPARICSVYPKSQSGGYFTPPVGDPSGSRRNRGHSARFSGGYTPRPRSPQFQAPGQSGRAS
jgi:hypothetical protein